MAAGIMISAGESSGDVYGAELIQEMARQADGPTGGGDLEFYGVGGPRMSEAGAEILFDPTRTSTIGFAEALSGFRAHVAALGRLREVLRGREPELLVLIDYPGFNLLLARLARKFGVPVAYFIPPACWAWGGRWRARRVLARTDLLLPIFPFAADLYRSTARESGASCRIEFVGHPLLDRTQTAPGPDRARSELEAGDREPLIAVLPGSRENEVKNLLPIMAEACLRIAEAFPEASFLLPCAESLQEERLRELMVENGAGGLDFAVTKGRTYDILEAADYALVTSGTAALEAAIFRTPMTIVYRASFSTWLLSRVLLRVSRIGLPNVVAGREIVPELLQGRATPSALAREAIGVLRDEKRAERVRADLEAVRARLGEPGAIQRAAGEMLRFISKERG